MTEIFPHCSPQARVWIYQADRNLLPSEIVFIEKALPSFLAEWAAHGEKLAAYGTVLHHRFLVLAVDEAQAMASGCSIDASVHWVSHMQQQLQVNFFDRLHIVAQDENGDLFDFNVQATENMLNNGQLSSQTLIFDNTIKNYDELLNAWQKPLSQTWLGKRFALAE